MIFNQKVRKDGSGSSTIEIEAFNHLGIIAKKVNESCLMQIEWWIKGVN